MATEYLAHAQVMPLDMEIILSQATENPWVKYAGVFKDDPYFKKVMDQMNAERQGED